MYMVMFVLDDDTHLDHILDAWSNGGVSGVTIIESTGLHRRKLKHIPMRYSYGETPMNEKGNTTLLTMVDDEPMVQFCLQEIEKIVGDLNGPNTGVFTSWPLALTRGIPTRPQGEKNK